MTCSREQVMQETWSQLKRSVNGEREILRDEDLHSWFLDPDIQPDESRPGYLRNCEPLLVNLENTWALRPDATTGIPNLFLASDYVRTYTDLATMEGANEAARRAVNGVLDSAGFDGARCESLGRCTNRGFPLPGASLRRAPGAVPRPELPWDATLTGVAARASSTGSGTPRRRIFPLMEERRLLYLRPVVEARSIPPRGRDQEAATASNAADAPISSGCLSRSRRSRTSWRASPASSPARAEIASGPGGFVEQADLVTSEIDFRRADSRRCRNGSRAAASLRLLDDFRRPVGERSEARSPASRTARALGGARRRRGCMWPRRA